MRHPKETGGWFACVVALAAFGVAAHAAAPAADDARSDPHLVVKLRPDDNAAADRFGMTVAVDGNLAVIGAPGAQPEDGVVYVYRHNGFAWQQERRLAPDTPVVGDLFGIAVAIEGDVIAIGAPLHDTIGGVYIFRYDYGGGGWVQEALLVLPDGANGDGFGNAVDLDGNTLIVGAFGRAATGFHSGAAYVYRYDGVEWLPDPALLPPAGSADTEFGYAVALDDNVALIGAVGTYGVVPARAHVFRFDGEAWNSEAELAPWAGNDTDGFGHAVALGENYAIVGAPDHDGTGGAFVFAYDSGSGTWLNDARLLPSDGTGNDAFAQRLAWNGSVLLVGAPDHNLPATESGAAYLFEPLAGGWTERYKIADPGAYAEDGFGTAVALDGDMAFIGAPRDDNVGLDSGALYVFDRIEPALTVATWTGGGGADRSYGNVANWDIDAIPVNDANAQYSIVIPAGMVAEFDLDDPGDVVDLTLEATATLAIRPGSQLTVLDDADIAGVVDNDSGIFRAAGNGARFVGDRPQLLAIGGPGTETAVAATACVATGNSTHHALFSAQSGATLSLPNLATLNAATPHGTQTRIESLGGSTVALPSLTQLYGPSSGSAELHFRCDASSSLELPALIAVHPGGNGRTFFDYDTTGVQMPALVQAGNVEFRLAALATWDLPNLERLEYAWLRIRPGATLNTPMLQELRTSGVVDLPDLIPGAADDRATTWNADNLVLLEGVIVDLRDGGVLNAPSLAYFVNSSVDMSPGSTFNIGNSALENIDNSKFTVDGVDFGTAEIAAERYTAAFLAFDQTLFAARGGGTLDLSGVASFDARYNGGVKTVEARSGGTVNLGDVQTLYGPLSGTLDFAIGAGSSIDLARLATIESDDGVSGLTTFTIESDSFALPALTSCERTAFDLRVAGTTLDLPLLGHLDDASFLLADGTTLNIPAVTAYTGTPGEERVLQVPAGGTVNADALATMVGVDVDLESGGVLNAPSLTTFAHGHVVLAPDRTFNVGPLADIDNSRIRVQGDVQFGAAFGNLTAATYSATEVSRYDDYLFRADGDAAVLDLSSIVAIDARYSAPTGTHNHEIAATGGGLISLSALETIEGPGGTEYLHLDIGADSQIDLSSLQTINSHGGTTIFDIDADPYALPSLHHAGGVRFNTVPDATLSLPALVTAPDVEFNVAAGATLNAPALQAAPGILCTIEPGSTVYIPECESHWLADSDGDDLLLPEGATLTAGWRALSGEITASTHVRFVSDGTVTLNPGAAANLPALSTFELCAVAIDPDRRFNTEALTEIDNSRIQVSGGAQWGSAFGNLSDAEYRAWNLFEYNDQNYRWRDWYVFTADGDGSVLDLSSLEAVKFDSSDSAGWYSGGCCANVYYVRAFAGGLLDLSQVALIVSPRNENDGYGYTDAVYVQALDGGTIVLSNLAEVRRWEDSYGNVGYGLTYLQVRGGGSMVLGALTGMYKTHISASDDGSQLGVNGHLRMSGDSTFFAGAGTEVSFDGDFSYVSANAADMVAHDAVFIMRSGSTQQLEVGSPNVGTDPGPGINFGFGRLFVGDAGHITTVELVDTFDNGNRGGGSEALYLYGAGNTEGLVLSPGSVLDLNALQAYTWHNGAWVHLNALFPLGATEVAFGDGLLRRDEPPVAAGDLNADGTVDAADFGLFADWMTGPGNAYPPEHGAADLDGEDDIDLHDYDRLMRQLVP
jgi:hypothetical protein